MYKYCLIHVHDVVFNTCVHENGKYNYNYDHDHDEDDDDDNNNNNITSACIHLYNTITNYLI